MSSEDSLAGRKFQEPSIVLNRIILRSQDDTIVLKQLIPEDAENLFQLVDADRAHLSQHGDTTAEKYRTAESVRDSIVHPDPKKPGKIRFGIWDGEIMVGSINLTPLGNDRVESGSWVGKAHTGYNYAARARGLLIDFAFDQLHAKEIVSKIIIGNEPSRRSVKRSGYLYSGMEYDKDSKQWQWIYIKRKDTTSFYLDTLLRIDDPDLIQVPEVENGETMVSLLELPRLVLPSKIQPQLVDITDSETPFARVGVRDRLRIAIQLLPEEYAPVLIEAKRTVAFQRQMLHQVRMELQKSNPTMSAEVLDVLVRSMASDPDIFSPHVTGGAVDIALADRRTMTYLDMGNLFQHDGTAASNCPGLTDKQNLNRRLLKDIMTQAGFENYPREWWHWSFGEKMWAYLHQQPHAIYGPIR